MPKVRPPSLLIHAEQMTPFSRGNGAETLPYIGKWNCPQGCLTTGITMLPPGIAIPLHTHNVEESVFMIEGNGLVQIDDESFEVRTGASSWVPAGVPHCFENRGPGIMRIFWIYGGLHVTRTICATGETFEHLSESDRHTNVRI